MYEKDYEAEMGDVAEFGNTDLKINPDFYIHMGIVSAQNALKSDNLREGIIRFCIIIDNVEVLCRAAKIITDEYREKLKRYKESEDYINLDKQMQAARLANKKLEYMMEEVFERKTVTQPGAF